MLETITEQELAEYGVVSAPDHLTGNPADVKAVFDRLVTQLVARAVNEIIDAHNGLETSVNQRIGELADDLKNHVDVDPSALKAENVAIAAVLVEKFGLTNLLAATVHDALEKAVSSAGDTIPGDLEVNNDKPSFRVGNSNGVKGHFTYDVENKELEIGLVDVERKPDEEYGEPGFVLGDPGSYAPRFGAKLKIGLMKGLEEVGFQPKFSTVEYDGSETEQTLLHTGNLERHGAAQVRAGSYVGTGTSGKDNATSLTFPFQPKFVMVCSGDTSSSSLLWYEGVTRVKISGRDGSIPCVRSGNTLSWYDSHYNDAGYQYNYAGTTYFYIAIG